MSTETKSIWASMYGSIIGGWKTHGPNSPMTPGAFASNDGDMYAAVSAEAALKLSPVIACMTLRAETLGSLPIHVRDKSKKILTDHPLYYILHDSPNARQTSIEYFSLDTAHIDMYGNAVSTIDTLNGRPIALNACDPQVASYEYTNKSHTRRRWKINGDEYQDHEVLHIPGFSMTGEWGISRLQSGVQILGAQIAANRSAQTAFKQGLKVGGFFEDTNSNKKGWQTEELRDFYQRLNEYGRMENAGKMMKLPFGLKPLSGSEFRINPVEAQLLESRFFGIEEICRLFNVPPQLIGQSNKASSWASSIENINLHFVVYSLTPTLVRIEKRLKKKLLTPAEISAGIEIKFNLSGLLRGDTASRQAFYASALQNGYLNRDEVRDLEDRGTIPGGDKYTVQTNMTEVNKMTETPKPAAGTKPTGDDDES